MNFRQITTALLFFVLFIGIMFGLVYFFSDWERLKTISGRGIALLLFFGFTHMLAQGLILRSILRLFGIHAQFKEWMGLLVITLFGNFLIPFSGIGFRAYYLKKKYSLSITNFISSVGIIYLLEMVCFAILGLVGLLSLYKNKGIQNPLLIVFFTVIAVSLVLLPLMANHIVRWCSFLPEKVKSMLTGLSLMKEHKSITFQVAFWTLIEALLFNALFWISYAEINSPVPFSELFVVTSLADFSFFFRLLPAALGSYEGFVLFGNHAMGLNQDDAFLVIALTRAAIFLIVLVFAPVFSYWLIKNRDPKGAED